MAQDASLAEQYPELASLVAKNEAEAEKEKGNRAFSEKRSVSGLLPAQPRASVCMRKAVHYHLPSCQFVQALLSCLELDCVSESLVQQLACRAQTR